MSFDTNGILFFYEYAVPSVPKFIQKEILVKIVRERKRTLRTLLIS